MVFTPYNPQGAPEQTRYQRLALKLAADPRTSQTMLNFLSKHGVRIITPLTGKQANQKIIVNMGTQEEQIHESMVAKSALNEAITHMASDVDSINEKKLQTLLGLRKELFPEFDVIRVMESDTLELV